MTTLLETVQLQRNNENRTKSKWNTTSTVEFCSMPSRQFVAWEGVIVDCVKAPLLLVMGLYFSQNLFLYYDQLARTYSLRPRNTTG
jgi:hypothetical protein